MFRRVLKEIKGMVFLDLNDDSNYNNSGQPVKDVKIQLFAVTGQETEGLDREEVSIRKEKLVMSTKTNDWGEFYFLANEGTYTVNLDIDTLPAGKGVLEAKMLIKPGEASSIHYAVKDAEAFNKNKKLDKNSFKPAAIACTCDKVRLAHRRGLIDDHERILNLLYALYDKRRLADNYRSHIPIKSGTGAIEEIKRYMDREDADPEVVEKARELLDSSIPELDKSYKSQEGNFIIHFTLTGEHAVSAGNRSFRGVPSYIKQIGSAFEEVRAFTCVKRGFREPILENGKSAYDVYVYDLKGVYGVTYASDINKISNVKAASSYICIDNSYAKEKGFDKSREDCMKVTAAHEYFHAVQLTYNMEADLWWKETTATWNEDEVFTGVNDYIRYIGSYFSEPEKSLDKTSYSGVVFAKFLTENYGGFNLIKRIWEIQASGRNNSIEAIDEAVREKFGGKDIGSLFSKFSAFNVNPAQYYKEGSLWKIAASAKNTYVNYPVSQITEKLDHLSSSYYLFRPDSKQGERLLEIVIDGSEGGSWSFKLQKRNREDKMFSITEIKTNSTFNKAEIKLNNFGEVYDEVYLIPSNLDKEQDGLQYKYTANIK